MTQDETTTPAEAASPSPSTSTSPGEEEDSSRASSAAEAGPFITDPGPTFDPEAAGAEPEPEPAGELHALPDPDPGWEQDSVRSILTAKGAALHAVVGVGEQDWLYTKADLAAIAPPLTNILNRYPTTRAAGGTGDELALVLGLSGYVGRSYIERKAVLDARAQEPEVPITGRAHDVVNDQEPGEPSADEEIEWTTPE